VALDLMKERGTPLEKQQFNWRDLVRTPISKLNDDAFTRVRVILQNGIEMEALNFSHQFARHERDLRRELATIRRIEKHQQSLVNNLLPADQSVLETTIAYEQVAIEVTATVAQHEPDPYMKQGYEYALLEDFDHLYRYSALLDRLEGKDPNSIVQSYSDIVPGRPTVEQHRHPFDDVLEPWDRRKAAPITKLHTLIVMAAEQQTGNYYNVVGPLYADPVARQLYAEISSIEEQHITHYESMQDPDQTWMERWLLHEAMEVYTYYCCMQQESNPRIKQIWEQMTDYELGHLQFVKDLFQRVERRDPAEVLPATLPEPLEFRSHRDYLRRVLAAQVDLRRDGPNYVPKDQLPPNSPTFAYQRMVNAKGSPSEIASAGYHWIPGTELLARARAVREQEVRVH